MVVPDAFGRLSARPRMHADAAFLAHKHQRLNEPHVALLNQLVHRRRTRDRDVPWVDPDSGGIHSRILFLLESPGPKSSTGHGSGIISIDNDDQTAARFWRLSHEVGLDRSDYVNWNVVPWYLSTTGSVTRPTPQDQKAALPYLHDFVSELKELRVVVAMGQFAARSWIRYLGSPGSPTLPLLVAPHPSAKARLANPAFEDDIKVAMAKARTAAKAWARP